VATNQHVPTDAVGGLVQWSKPISTQYLLSAGADFRRIKGASEEQGMNTTNGLTVATVRDGRGTQISSGTFVQIQYLPVPKLSLTASGRVGPLAQLRRALHETTVATGLPDRATSEIWPTRKRLCSAPSSPRSTT
jgi:hypothetical protein